jgi:Tfp pilus assembly protein PilZ
VIKNVREFMAAYQPSGGNGGVFCPTRSKLQNRDPVAVKVRLRRRQPPMILHGLVAWRRPGRHLLKIRAGIGVEFLPGEKAKCDYLLDLASSGTSVQSRRRHERVLVDLPIIWRPLGSTENLPGKLRDIGRGGAFVLSPASVPDQSQVVIELAPPGAQVPIASPGPARPARKTSSASNGARATRVAAGASRSWCAASPFRPGRRRVDAEIARARPRERRARLSPEEIEGVERAVVGERVERPALAVHGRRCAHAARRIEDLQELAGGALDDEQALAAAGEHDVGADLRRLGQVAGVR